jgi:SOS-response transcriptional repressor LexA
MMTWKDRIEQIKSTFGIKNNKQLEQSLGLSNGYINDLVGGIKNKNPSKIIASLAEKYKISPIWFFDESVGMFGDKRENAIRQESELILAIRRVENNHEDRFSEIETRLSALESLVKQEKPALRANPNKDYPSHTADLGLVMVADGGGTQHTYDPAPAYGGEEEEREQIPYVHNIAAGPPTEIDGDRSETVGVPSRLLREGERYYAARVRGGSMTGAGIRDGDMALIRHADVPRDGAIQVVRHRDRVTLKLLREVEGKGWELRYMDGSGKAILCDTDGYETLGEFVTVLPKSAAPRGR